MPKILLIPEDRLRAIFDEAVDRVLTEGSSIDLAGFVPIGTIETPPPEPDSPPHAPSRPKVGMRHRISPGKTSYADVIWTEIAAEEFAFKDAWKVVKDLIDTKAKMPRALARRSMDHDSRFERIPDRDGIWYRRVEML